MPGPETAFREVRLVMEVKNQVMGTGGRGSALLPVCTQRETPGPGSSASALHRALG